MQKLLSKNMTKSFFELQSNFKVDYAPATFKKWKSGRTGLQLTWIDQESPMVNGYFAVATEILNDSGCPHTLEHLIFMGSEKYPYKGLLDVISNLAFSQTNAWTATDQTVYTLTTAGWDGFKMILPVYLDHLINPTITDEGCLTEVHHVDGDAKDKGVVYSEMQGIENQSWFISGLESQRTLYKYSGYKSETGGLTENLRTLKPDTIRKYHADNYRPDNLNVIITGSIDEEELLKIMIKFDSELISLPETPNKRPFVDSKQDLPLTEKIIRRVEFPDKDESSSEILISWIGPGIEDSIVNQAIDILGKYFTASSISLFNKNFIEIDNPLASGAEFYTEDYVRTGMNIMFNNVPTEEVESLPDQIFELLEKHCNSKDLDLTRLQDLVEQTKWKFIFDTEQSSGSFASLAILEFLYGRKDSRDLSPWIKDLFEFEELQKWTVEQWLEVYKKYFLDNKPCIVISKPSNTLNAKLKEAEKKLIEDRKEKLGEEGLKKLANKLKLAQEKNDSPIPKTILDSFTKPDPSKINFIKTLSIGTGLNKEVINDVTNEATKKIIDDTPADFPLYVHVEDIESNFVTVHLLFSSFEVSKDLLQYVHLFRTLFSLPIENDDGTLTSYEDVVKQLKRDTVRSSASIGFLRNFEEMLDFKITVKAENYEKAIEWFGKLLFKTKFTKERVKVALDKLVNSLPDYKRAGPSMCQSLISKYTLTDRSLNRAADEVGSEDFLRDLLAQIDDGKFGDIEKKLESFRNQLITLNNTRVLIIGDVNKLNTPISSWNKFINISNTSDKALTIIPESSTVLSEIGKEKAHKGFILTTPGSESSYMNVSTNIPFGYNSADTYKITLAAEYLQCVEGPFWRGIRGTGLAYGASIYKEVGLGQLTYSIYRGADIEKCFEVGKEIVGNFISGETPIDEKMLQGAISSIVNSLTESQSNFFQSSERKFLDDILAKRGPNYSNTLMKELTKLTSDDLIYALKKYFDPLFDPEHSIAFIVCHPSKLEGVEKYFTDKGYDITVEHAKVAEGELDGTEDEDESESDSEEETDDE